MKKIVWGFIMVFLIGCSAARPIGNVLRDREYTHYQKILSEMERDYLQKKITYADYLEKKKAADDDYQKKIDQRRALIQNEPVRQSLSEIVP